MNERIGPRAWRERYVHPGAWDQQFAPETVTELFAQSVARFGENTLVDFLGRTTSYRAVMAEARAFAAGLQVAGLGKGDRIGLYLPNVPIYLSAFFGTLLAGATVVNFSPLYSAEELEAQVADSGTRLMVTINVPTLLPTARAVMERTGLERLVVGRIETMLPFWQGLGMRLFRRRDLSSIPHAADITRWSAFLSDRQPLPVAIDPLTDLALLQYTGGTTGTPKGAMLTHQNMSANARQIAAVDHPQGERDVTLGVLPLFHVFANACILNRTTFRGGCIAMLPRFHPDQTLAAVERVKPILLFGVPTMFQALLDHEAIATTDFSAVKTCVSGGAPLPPPVKQRFESITGSRLIEGYGLTECSGVATSNPFDGPDRDGTIGHPLPGTDVRLLDKDDPLLDAAPGQPGELAISGPQVMLGYWKRPELAGRTFVERDGARWLRTGDVATIDEDGYIRIVDRLKDMIVVGGFKVFPSQVEAALLHHPAIREVLVIGIPDAYYGEVPRAFVTLKPGATASPEELRDGANAHLGKHEHVEQVVIREALPKTAIGKLDRKTLRAEVIGPVTAADA